MEHVDRKQLRLWIDSPSISAKLTGRLARVAAEVLVDVVLDGAEKWWRRRACAQSLGGRVPAGRVAALLAYVRDRRAETQVREAVLAALSSSPEVDTQALLAWLRAQDGVDLGYGFDVVMLRARAGLGDLSTVRPFAALAAEPGADRRAVGEKAIDALLVERGLGPVLAALGADSLVGLALGGADPAVRLLGVRLLHRAGADVTPGLADPSPLVARSVLKMLAGTRGDDDALWRAVEERAPGHLWALLALHRRGHPVRDAWARLGAPRVELPGVPPDVREAILRAYAPGQRETDPRWLLEAACLPERAPVAAEEWLRRAGEALAGAGLEPAAPIPAREEYGLGRGTYHTFATRAGAVEVSTLGPFFALEETDEVRVLDALRAAGFRHIDAALGGTRFEGLCVYFFGARAPLRVSDLLFYWQD